MLEVVSSKPGTRDGPGSKPLARSSKALRADGSALSAGTGAGEGPSEGVAAADEDAGAAARAEPEGDPAAAADEAVAEAAVRLGAEAVPEAGWAAAVSEAGWAAAAPATGPKRCEEGLEVADSLSAPELAVVLPAPDEVADSLASADPEVWVSPLVLVGVLAGTAVTSKATRPGVPRVGEVATM